MNASPADAPMHVCLGCGSPMTEIGCKIRCGACGYFEDCGNGLTPPPTERVMTRPAARGNAAILRSARIRA